MKTIRLGLIGLGLRGSWWLRELLKMEDVKVNAVCDIHEDRMEKGREMCLEKYGTPVFGCTNSHDVMLRDDIDAVIIPTYWNDHAKIAIDAMRHGKYAAFEVGPAQSIQQCWDLVHAYEETGVPCMLLENCCYGREEMTVLHMIHKGLFGELLHCEGGYQHDLRDEIAGGLDNDHERTWHHLYRNGEIYPTHEIGPMMSYLDVNHGNRMIALNAMATKSRGLQKYVREHLPADHPLQGRDFKLGDIVTTTIRCANGETIVMTHDTSNPRPYSRAGRVQGTGGIWMADKNALCIEGRTDGDKWEPMDNYMEEFEHPLWKKTRAAEFRGGGHGGMDWLVMRAFLDAVRNGTQTPIDVYDSATMMAISVLSEESIMNGSAPVSIPDFTNGMWFKREQGPKSIFSLYNRDESVYDGDVEF